MLNKFYGIKNFRLSSKDPELEDQYTSAFSAAEALEIFHLNPSQLWVLDACGNKLTFRGPHKRTYVLEDLGFA